MSCKTEFTARKIAQVIRGRAQSNAPIDFFLDEARRVIMNGKEMDYLSKREFRTCRNMTEDDARKKLSSVY